MKYVLVAVEDDYKPEQLEFEILAQVEVAWDALPLQVQAELDKQLG